MTDADLTETFIEETLPTYSLSDEDISAIEKAIQEDQDEAILETLDNLGVHDTAELIAKTTTDVRTRLVGHHLKHIDPYVFTDLAPELRKETLESLTPEQVASILSSLESDDALDMILNLDPLFQKEISSGARSVKT